ncbi:MAG: hypothetical protein QOI55_3078, partial [Actinomycetota bacterium]|nr:hypothetical protein [Actinomycetota bacterium]
LGATASSGLPVSYDVVGACGINGSTVTLSNAGVCSIAARQSGDANFGAAPDVKQQVTVRAPATRGNRLDLRLDFSAGTNVADAQATIAGEGLLPFSEATITVHSTPQVIGHARADVDGAFLTRVTLPIGLEAGDHRILVAGTAADGTPLTTERSFAIAADGTIARVDPPAIEAVGAPSLPRAVSGARFGADTGRVNDLPAAKASKTSKASEASKRAASTVSAAQSASGLAASSPALTRYDPAAHAHAVITIGVSAFALLSLTAAGALADASGRSGGNRSTRRRSGSVASAKVAHHQHTTDDAARGDGSRTWLWPATAALTERSATLPARVAPVSPLFARVLTDGSYLRAMFGSLSLLLPVAGVGLAIAGVVDTGGHALPPSLAIVVALVVLGALDALTGFLATVVFALGIVVCGGAGSADSVRTLLGLGALWFAVPLIASAARPFRRVASNDGNRMWWRAGDFVIASLVGAWVAQKMVGALPGLSGLELPIAKHADLIALVVLATLLFRLSTESLCAAWYPDRLAAVQPASVPRSGTAQRLFALALRSAIFVFAAIAFVGNCWQLWVGAALFVVPQLVGFAEDRLPNVARLYAVLPRGILKTVVMLFVGAWFGRLVSAHVDDPRRLIADGFVLLALPGLAFTALAFVGRDGKARTMRWQHHLAGAAVLLVGVLSVRGVIG